MKLRVRDQLDGGNIWHALGSSLPHRALDGLIQSLSYHLNTILETAIHEVENEDN